MALTNINSTSWTDITLSTPEIWQSRGRFFWSTADSPGPLDGIEMGPGIAHRFDAGTVKVRAAKAGTADAPAAQVAREEVA